jgi:protein subunit release factor A
MSLSVIIEVRAAEGGDDAKALVDQQLAIYARRAARSGL